MLEMINAVKVYHWNTRSFAEHKATDELYGKLNEHVDQFVEVLLGKQGDRLDRLDRRIELLQPKDKTDFKNRIFQYRAFLMHLDTCLHDKRDTDLLSIRDDILSDVNQFIYLLTFDK
jgi:DNA-binding ferritin-like protein